MMLRKTKAVIEESFYTAKNKTIGQTKVIVTDNEVKIKLYNTIIAKRNILSPESITIQTGGFNTQTTFERLRILKNVNIQTKKGIVYLNGEVWNGENVEIKQ